MIKNQTALIQLPLEFQMLDQGKQRYQKMQEANAAMGQLTKAQMKVLSAALPLVSTRLISDLNEADNEGKGRTSQWVLPLRLLDPDVLAFIGLNQTFGAVAKGHDVRKLCKNIGQYVNIEVWQLELHKSNPKLFERLLKQANKHSSYKYKKNTVTAVAKKAGHEFDRWDDEYSLRVGSAVLNAILTASGLFELYDKPEGFNNTKKMIGMTHEAVSILKDMDEAAKWMIPYFKPMAVPPRKWESQHTGCYFEETLAYFVPLVRTYDKAHKRLIDEAIQDGTMQGVLDSLNTIQEVPLRINHTVYDMVKYCWDNGIVFGKFPSKKTLTEPALPIEWFTLSPEEKKLWKKNKEKIILRNRAIEADILNMAQDLGTAKEYKEMGTFYLPHSLDFRGRVYPVPVFNHQRADHIRSMFEFASGKPLGPDGAYWLGIHLANCGDFQKVSKKSFDDRFQWVLENTEWIVEIANDPVGNLEQWVAADKPFSFLAACMEWRGFIREGQDFVSHLPIALDGSNSGLQHYSAALRDEVGGLTVNLKATPVPQDVYQVVADVVLQEVQKDNDPLATLWLNYGINRKVVKRCVMTFPYSSEQFGFKQHLLEDLMKPLEDEVLAGHLTEHPFGEDSGRAAAGYLAKKIWGAVNQVVSKAAEGMRFLQKCAGAMAHEGKPLLWVTPMGFPVLHKYEEWEVKRVAMFLHDRSVPVIAATNSDKITADGEVLKKVVANLRTKPKERIIKDRQRNAVAPNFIHSLDAAHLQMTVMEAKMAGMQDFLLIHDSFSTHACNTGEFQHIIKRTFVEMYQWFDVFDDFYRNVYDKMSDKTKVPLPPEKGNLDLNETMASEYCFS